MSTRIGRLLAGMLLIAALTRSSAQIVIETRTNPANGHVYSLLTESTWTEAESRSVVLRGHLVSIGDAAENEWVFQTFGQARNLWLGLYADPAGLHWTDGTPPVYLDFWDFSDGYPAEPYAVMGTGYAGRWDDWNSSTPWPVNGNPIFGVVEVVPEPSACTFVAAGGLLVAGIQRRRRENAA